jgi:succinate dehydrogenase/fumarate reductase flavoprotein subunit
MSETKKNEDILADEFRNLGKNLAEVMRAAWESPERKNIQAEIETGLDDLGKSLNQEVNSFRQSPSGQRLKEDVEELNQRIRNGEVTTKARDELLAALKRANEELQNVLSRWQGTGKSKSTSSSSPEEPIKEA